MRRAVSLLLVAVTVPTVAFFIGVNSGADSLRAKQAAAAASKIDAVEPGPLRQQVIEREVIKIKTETKYVHPEACARAVQLATEALEETYRFSATTTDVLEASRLLGKAIVLEEVAVLIKARNKLHDYESDTLGSIFNLGDISKLLSESSENCRTELGKQDS